MLHAVTESRDLITQVAAPQEVDALGRVLPATIYVVDLFAAGEQAAGELMQLLKAALEDSSKTKVLHDARLVGGWLNMPRAWV